MWKSGPREFMALPANICSSYLDYRCEIVMPDILAQHWFPISVVAALALILLVKLRRQPVPYPYRHRPSLLTAAEQRFYHQLRKVVGDKWAIFAMVRLADLIRVQPGTSKYQSWQNRINAKHLDFVLCDIDSLEPRLGIELDDRSHQRVDRIERDLFVNQALRDAKLPLLRVQTQQRYNASELSRAVNAAIKRHVSKSTSPVYTIIN